MSHLSKQAAQDWRNFAIANGKCASYANFPSMPPLSRWYVRPSRLDPGLWIALPPMHPGERTAPIVRFSDRVQAMNHAMAEEAKAHEQG